VQTLLQWKSYNYYIFWVCVCSLRYPACNARATYCHLCPVRLYHIFPHYLINGTIFGRRYRKYVKCVFWFSLQILPEIFLILITINVQRSSCRVPVVILISSLNLNFLDIYSKNQVLNLMKIRPLRADWLHTGIPIDINEDNRHFAQFLRTRL
jgi:hypothetical protein